MKEIESIESLESASALLHPLRTRLLELAAEPISAVEVAAQLGESAQKINYHLKELEKAGLLKKVREEKRRNLTKAYYQAQARQLWFSPRLLAERGEDARVARDQTSLHNLIGLAHEMERDVVSALNASRRRERGQASLGVKAELAFPSGEARRAFLQAYMGMLDALVRRFGAQEDAAAGERYKALLAVYPAPARRGRRRSPGKAR